MSRILQKDFGITPYKVQWVRKLKPRDHSLYFIFSKWANEQIINDADFVKEYIFGQSSANASNTSYCEVRIVKRRHHWPSFKKNQDGATVFVNRDTYRRLLTDFCWACFLCGQCLLSAGWCNLATSSCHNPLNARNV